MVAFNINLTFGLISVPAKYEKATETKVEMKNLCVGSNGKPAHDPKPLVAPKKCPDCGEIQDFTTIVKGVKQGSTYAVVTQDDVKEAKVQNTDAYKGKLDLVAHPAEDFLTQTAQGGTLYYVKPATGAEDHYQLLVKLIDEHRELAFAGLHTPRSAAGLYLVTTRDGVLVMEQRTREQALLPAPEVGGSINEPMYDLLEATLEKVITPYDPDAYEDKYAMAVAKLAIEAQDQVALGSSKKAGAAPAKPSSDDDLMKKLAALAES